MDAELILATTTDSDNALKAAADNDEAAARVPAPKLDVEKLDGSTAVSFEHERSERQMLLQRLAQHEKDLAELTTPGDSEQVTSNEEKPASKQQKPDDILEKVRAAAVSDAVQHAREKYSREQQQAHFSKPQAEINALRAELLPSFQAKVKALLADADVKQLEEAAQIPLPNEVLDSLLSLPGGSEATAFLLKNAAEVKRLSSLPPHMGIAHVAQLANRFNPAAQRRPSAAPAPISPISGSSTKSSKPPEEMTYAEYRTWRDQQQKARRR